MSNERSRRWQLTENNASYDKKTTAELLAKLGTATYVVACSEIGDRGTKHNHAFVIYENAISLNTLKKTFPRAHFEPCVGSNQANRDYIVKDDSEPFESGEMPLTSTKRRKGDIASEVVARLMAGSTLFEIMSEADFSDYIVRNFRALKDIENQIEHERLADEYSKRKRWGRK